MPDDEAESAVEAAEDADPDDAEHDAATEDEQPDADSLPSPQGLPEPDTDPDDEDREETEDSDDSDDETPETTDSASASATGDTMGDLYAQMLVQVTNAIIEQHGQPDAEPVDVEAARQADIDHHFDRLMDEMGIGSDMTPAQGVVLSSTMFVGGAVVAKTDVAKDAVGEMEI